MTGHEIIQEIALRGLSLHLDGEALRWRGPAGAFTQDLKEMVRADKVEISQALKERDRSRESCPACLRADCRGCELEGAFLARRERAGVICQQAKNEWEQAWAEGLRQGLLEVMARQQAMDSICQSDLWREGMNI